MSEPISSCTRTRRSLEALMLIVIVTSSNGVFAAFNSMKLIEMLSWSTLCWCYQSTGRSVRSNGQWDWWSVCVVILVSGSPFVVFLPYDSSCVWVFEWRMTVAQVYVLRTMESVLLRSFLWHHRRLRWNYFLFSCWFGRSYHETIHQLNSK